MTVSSADEAQFRDRTAKVRDDFQAFANDVLERPGERELVQLERECTDAVRLLRDNKTRLLREVAQSPNHSMNVEAVTAEIDSVIGDVLTQKAQWRERSTRPNPESTPGPTVDAQLSLGLFTLDPGAPDDVAIEAKLELLSDLRGSGMLSPDEFAAARAQFIPEFSQQRKPKRRERKRW